MQPTSPEQKRFIEAVNGRVEAFSNEEFAWFKYLARKRIEEKYGENLKNNYHVQDDSFYNRDGKKDEGYDVWGDDEESLGGLNVQMLLMNLKAYKIYELEHKR